MPRWIVFICLITFVILLLLLQFHAVLLNRKFSFKCKDPNISHTSLGDTISAKQLLISVFLGPLLILAVVEAINNRSIKNLNKTTIWALYKRCLIGVTLIILITEFIKTVTQEPRPHFIESCKPDANEGCEEGINIFQYNCTNSKLTKYSQADLTRSFPSGHTSLSLFTALYCSYLILIRLPSGFKENILRILLITICFVWSFICSLSRITDKRHHWWDVMGGATLGICFFCLFQRLQKSSLIEYRN